MQLIGFESNFGKTSIDAIRDKRINTKSLLPIKFHLIHLTVYRLFLKCATKCSDMLSSRHGTRLFRSPSELPH